MASIGTDNGGRKRILFVADDGSRKTVRLGKVSMKQAESWKLKIEDLIGGVAGGRVIHADTETWLAEDVNDTMHARLAAVGLVKPRTEVRAGLGAFMDAYLADKPGMKEHTRLNWIQLRQWLVKHFGETCDMRTIGNNEAENWRAFMVGKGLGENTMRRHIGRARQLFKSAIRRGLVRGVNPFEGMAATVRADKGRQFFVKREDVAKVIDACPDNQWKLMVALSRFGGLRCPSETLALRWGDVDFEKSRIRVPSPKTEHHEGKESRIIPLFPELRKPLVDVYTEAPEGTEWVITRYREKYSNLRTQFGRIIRKAGLKVWQKPWHNMRATRQTELAEKYPIHVVCEWIGNSRAVAQEHYLQLTDAHFTQAIAEPDESAAQNPAQYPPVHNRSVPHGVPLVGAGAIKNDGEDTYDATKYPRQDSNL